jgi:uncharacterized protein (DUF58 family)
VPADGGGPALTARGTAALHGFATLALGCLLIAVVSGRPDLVALGAGLAAPVVVALARLDDPDVRARLEPSGTDVTEGEVVEVTVVLTSTRPVAYVAVDLQLPDGVSRVSDPLVAHVGPELTARVVVSLRAQRWGQHRIGPIRLRASDELALSTWTRVEDQACELVAYPSRRTVRSIIVASRARHALGELPARPPGEGTELADVRRLRPGEPARRLHARQSARRGVPIVAERHPERAADVVVLLDTFSAAGGSLDRAIRGAAALAASYMSRRDRVGLVTFGGSVSWLAPAMGTGALHRLMVALVRAEVVFSYAWPDIAFVPPRVLPPRALVLAVSPLLDRRMVSALVDLRRRGYDVAVIEVEPRRPVAGTAERRLAERLWRLERDALRDRLARSSIAVGVWPPEAGLEVALESIAAFRRHTLRHPVAA